MFLCGCFKKLITTTQANTLRPCYLVWSSDLACSSICASGSGVTWSTCSNNLCRHSTKEAQDGGDALLTTASSKSCFHKTAPHPTRPQGLIQAVFILLLYFFSPHVASLFGKTDSSLWEEPSAASPVTPRARRAAMLTPNQGRAAPGPHCRQQVGSIPGKTLSGKHPDATKQL